MDSDSDDNLIDDDLPPAQFGFLNLRQTGGQGGGQTTTNRKKETRAKYRDYHSIDWLRELSRDRQRHHLIANDRASEVGSTISVKIGRVQIEHFYKNSRIATCSIRIRQKF